MPIYEVEHPQTKQIIEVELDGPPTDEQLSEVFAQVGSPETASAPPAETGGSLRFTDEQIAAAKAANASKRRFVPMAPGASGMPSVEPGMLPEDLRREQARGQVALLRYGLPAAAAAATGVASVPTQIAVGLLAGGGGEFGAQQSEIAAGSRDTIDAGDVGASALSAAIPFVKAGSALKGVAANTALQAIGQGVAEGIRTDDATEGLIGGTKAGVLTAGITSATGPLGRRLVTGLSAMLDGSSGTQFQRFMAGMLRPIEQSKTVAQMAAARSAIKSATGVDIPVGLAESIGSPSIVNAIKNQDVSELSSQAMDVIKQTVLNNAADAMATGRSIENISDDVIRILRNDVGDINDATVSAIKRLSSEYAPALQRANTQVVNEAAAIVPRTTATPDELGEAVRGLARSARDEFKATDANLFNAVRADPDYSSVQVKPNAIGRWLDDLRGSVIKDAEGNVIPFGMAQGVKEQVGGMEALGTVEQSLEAMRNVRTRVGESIGDPNLLQGLGDKQKKALYRAITEDINAAIDSTSGTLGKKLKAANEFHRSNVDRFIGRDVQSVLSEFGVETGSAPGALLSQLKNKQKANSFISRMRDLAGPSQSAEMDRIAGEYLFNEVGSGLVSGGKLPVGGMVSSIEKLAPEIQQAYFPKLKDLKDLAVKEAKLAGLPHPEKAADLLTLGGDEMLQELRSGSKTLSTAISGAIRAQTSEQLAMLNGVRRAIRNKGEGGAFLISKPVEVVDQIIMGNFSSKEVKQMLDMIGAENGAVRDEIKTLFIDKLLKKSASSKGSLSVAIEDAIKPPSGADPGGELYDRAKAILGNKGYDDVSEMVKQLKLLDEGRMASPEESILMQALFRVTGGLFGASSAGASVRVGGIGGANQAGYIQKQLGKIRYAIAAKLYTTPELREIRSTPVSKMTVEQFAKLAAAFTKSGNVLLGSTEASDYEDAAEVIYQIGTQK